MKTPKVKLAPATFLLFCLGILGVVFIARVLSVTADFRRSNRFEQKINKFIEEKGFQGAVLLTRDDKIIFAGGWGFSDSEENLLSVESVFREGSLTKQFTGVAVARLIQEGKLSETDKLEKFFPQAVYGSQVTVRDLLRMESGIPEYNGNQELAESFGEDFMIKGVDRDIFLEALLGLSLDCEPGKSYNYSNTNYYLLGCIIEQVTGQQYEAYIEETLLEPCAMFDSGFGDEEKIARSLDLTDSGREEINSRMAFAAGGMYTTVLDLYRWQSALYSGELGVDVKNWFPEDCWYNYGLKLNGDGVYCHQGLLNIANSFMGYDTNTGVQIIVLSNTYPAEAETVADYINTLMKGE